jgi:hypothetical protein
MENKMNEFWSVDLMSEGLEYKYKIEHLGDVITLTEFSLDDEGDEKEEQQAFIIPVNDLEPLLEALARLLDAAPYDQPE